MKKGKATGPDKISTEMLRALYDQNIDVSKVTFLFCYLYTYMVENIPTDLQNRKYFT